MISVDRVNDMGSKLTITGWFAGLAWTGVRGLAPGLTLWDWLLLVVVGMFAASIIIGGGLALIAGLFTKLSTGKSDGSPHAFSWAALIAPVIAFFVALPVARLLE